MAPTSPSVLPSPADIRPPSPELSARLAGREWAQGAGPAALFPVVLIHLEAEDDPRFDWSRVVVSFPEEARDLATLPTFAAGAVDWIRERLAAVEG